MEELNARILRVDDEQNPKAQRDVLDMIYAMVRHQNKPFLLSSCVHLVSRGP